MRSTLVIPIAIFAVILAELCCCATTPAINTSSTQKPRLTSTNRPIYTARPTNTRYPTSIPKPTATNSAPGFTPLLGKIYSGVEVYYGANKAYGFKILGGADDCSYFPSGRGIKVQYSDGTVEWKDRLYLISSGIFYIKEDDPAIDKMEWYEYSCP